jgi:hypothetical protein
MASRQDDIHLYVPNYCLRSLIEAQYLAPLAAVHHLEESKQLFHSQLEDYSAFDLFVLQNANVH